MEQSKQQRIRELTDRLNRCRYEYYNLNAPSLTDAEYDALFDELSMLEKETGFSMTNSPTQTVLKHQMMDVLSLLLVHTIPSFAKSHQKISCHAINSRQLIYLNWWLSPCSIIVLHTDRHNLTCSGAASFNMLANSTEMLTSGGTGMLLPSRV